MKTIFKIFLMVLILPVASFWGCAQQRIVKRTPAENSIAQSADSRGPKGAAATSGLKTVYFDFDSAQLIDKDRQILKENAVWLKSHPDARVLVEGRCDERGTEEYNLALGQRRASAVERYYVHAGIRKSRVSSISYGKDKPVCIEETDSCRAQNRQVDGISGSKTLASR